MHNYAGKLENHDINGIVLHIAGDIWEDILLSM